MDASASTSSILGWQVLRWLIVPVAVCFGWWVGVRVAFFSPEMPGAFFAAALLVLPGALAAPRHQLMVAGVLAVACVLLRGPLFYGDVELLGSVLGGVFAVSFVAGIALVTQRWVLSLAPFALSVLTCGACVRITESRRLAEDATPDPVPEFVVDALGERSSEIRAAYVDGGSFLMTTSERCRVDLAPELVEILVRELRLARVDALPPYFWQERMSYWPQRMPQGGECFSRESHNDPECIDEHEVIYLLHDRAADCAFISYYASL